MFIMKKGRSTIFQVALDYLEQPIMISIIGVITVRNLNRYYDSFAILANIVFRPGYKSLNMAYLLSYRLTISLSCLVV